MQSRTPIHERIVVEEDYDEMLSKQRKNRPKKNEFLEEEHTFEPRLGGLGNEENDKKRTVEDLLQWGTEKRVKLANQRLRKMEGNLYTFQPEIDEKSKKMIRGKSRQNVKVEDRLISAGLNRKTKLDELIIQEEKMMFKPDINYNSKQLLKKKDEVFKVDNGALLGVDFYKAVPKTDYDDMALKSKKRNMRPLRKAEQKVEIKLRMGIWEGRKL